jgi:hypothetical protein
MILDKRNEFIDNMQAFLKRIIQDYDEKFSDEDIERFKM